MFFQRDNNGPAKITVKLAGAGGRKRADDATYFINNEAISFSGPAHSITTGSLLLIGLDSSQSSRISIILGTEEILPPYIREILGFVSAPKLHLGSSILLRILRLQTTWALIV